MKVLLVDKEHQRRDLCRAQLEKFHYEVTVMSDFNAAWAAVGATGSDFDLVLLDWALAAPEGETNHAACIQNIAWGAPVILLTDQEVSPAMLHQAIAMGAVAPLQRPLDDQTARNIWQHVVRKACSVDPTDPLSAIPPAVSSPNAPGTPDRRHPPLRGVEHGPALSLSSEDSFKARTNDDASQQQARPILRAVRKSARQRKQQTLRAAQQQQAASFQPAASAGPQTGIPGFAPPLPAPALLPAAVPHPPLHPALSLPQLGAQQPFAAPHHAAGCGMFPVLDSPTRAAQSLGRCPTPGLTSSSHSAGLRSLPQAAPPHVPSALVDLSDVSADSTPPMGLTLRKSPSLTDLLSKCLATVRA
ncbi:unnamed protein product [Pedinophyceae sp. YPF-701]|nr:unnamed protein product [Pedinophyceae sp. YPF-701]